MIHNIYVLLRFKNIKPLVTFSMMFKMDEVDISGSNREL